MILSNYRDMYATKFGLPLSARYKHAEEDVQRVTKEILRQHPDHSIEEAEGRALARLDSQEHQRQQSKSFIVTKNHNWRRWAEIAAFVALLITVIVLSAVLAHGQVDGLKLQKDGVNVGNPCMAGICGVNFQGSGCNVTKSGQVWTVTCTSGAVTNNPGGSVNSIQYNDGSGFGGIADPGSAGKVLISQPSGPAAFADPLVQGLYATASATEANPVQIGAYDGTNVRRISIDTSGRINTNINGTVAVTQSGAWSISFTAPQHVIIDSATLGTVAVSGPLTDTQLRATPVPVSGTFWQATQPVSIASMPSTPVTGTFWQATQPVSLASVPSHAVTNAGTFAVQAAQSGTWSVTATQATGSNLHVVVDTAPSTAVTNQGLTDLDTSIQAVGSAVPANVVMIGGTDGTNAVRYYVDPCQRGAKSYYPVNISTATTVRFSTPTASQKTYICSIVLVASAAQNVNIIEGTGGTCGTGTAGILGGTTAATGLNLAANGGLTMGNGSGAIIASAGTNVDVCLITANAVQTSGHIAYVKAP